MTRLLRTVAYYYMDAGIGAFFGRTVDYARRRLWSDSVWVVYSHALLQHEPSDPHFLARRELDLPALVEIGYFKARAYPEELRRRFDHGNVCHGFFVGDCLATIGWSSPGYLELDRNVQFPCAGSVGLFDFTTLTQFRSRGCYTNALTQLCVEMRCRGFGSAHIAVDPGNVPSIRGIERAGFRPIATVKRSWRLGRRVVTDSASVRSAGGVG